MFNILKPLRTLTHMTTPWQMQSCFFLHLSLDMLFVIWTVFNPNSSNPNKVWFGAVEIGSPKGFLAYSETGRREVSLPLPMQEILAFLEFVIFC